MMDSGANIIGLDWMVDMNSAAEKYGDRMSFCGNVDPVAIMMQSSLEKVYTKRRSTA
jgi:uroporphyrinogen-III decarboxylase